jgi:uncharacterized protein with HEPN domain
MSRVPLVYLLDIIECIENIEEDVEGLSIEEFSRKRIVQQACVRNLEIIGEAVQRLPKELKEKYPTIPWRKIVAMRNKIAHEYFGLKITVIWKTISEDLPVLRDQIKLVVKDNESKKD